MPSLGSVRRRLRVACADYHVSEEAVTSWMAVLASRCPHIEPATYLSSVQAALTVQIADVHNGECDSPDCETCGEIADALAVLAAAQRLWDRDEFHRIVQAWQ